MKLGNKMDFCTIPLICIELNICPWFEYAKKYDLYGYENKISNTTIINKFNNKTEILNIFSHKKTTFPCIPSQVHNVLISTMKF